MSAWEDVPTPAETAMMERDGELDEYMRDVYTDLLRAKRECKLHDSDWFLCDSAGGKDCLALGHKPEPDGQWDDETHPVGWNDEPICPATQYGAACSYCENECDAWEIMAMSTRAEFWALVLGDNEGKATL